MKNNICTVIDIGTANIKLVEIGMASNGINLNKFSILPVNEEYAIGGTTQNPEGLIQAVKTEINSLGYDKQNGVILIPNHKVISREIALPVMPLKALDSAVGMEAEQYFPVNLSNYKVDYKILEQVETDEGNKYRIYIVAVPEENMGFYINIIDKSGLEPKVIDINSNTLYKLVSMENMARIGTQAQNTFAVFDIGAGFSHIVFAFNGAFMFEKSIESFNGNVLTELISKYLMLNYSEAEKNKIENQETYMELTEEDQLSDAELYAQGMGLTDDQQRIRIMKREIKKVINDLVVELNKVIQYFYSKFGYDSLFKIYLTGGGAQLKGLDEILSQGLGIDVGVLSELKLVNNYSGVDIGTYAVYLASSLGGIIREGQEG